MTPRTAMVFRTRKTSRRFVAVLVLWKDAPRHIMREKPDHWSGGAVKKVSRLQARGGIPIIHPCDMEKFA